MHSNRTFHQGILLPFIGIGPPTEADDGQLLVGKGKKKGLMRRVKIGFYESGIVFQS
jgi:hypothetical protein